MSQLIVNHDWRTRVGIELLGQLKTDPNLRMSIKFELFTVCRDIPRINLQMVHLLLINHTHGKKGSKFSFFLKWNWRRFWLKKNCVQFHTQYVNFNKATCDFFLLWGKTVFNIVTYFWAVKFPGLKKYVSVNKFPTVMLNGSKFRPIGQIRSLGRKSNKSAAGWERGGNVWTLKSYF